MLSQPNIEALISDAAIQSMNDQLPTSDSSPTDVNSAESVMITNSLEEETSGRPLTPSPRVIHKPIGQNPPDRTDVLSRRRRHGADKSDSLPSHTPGVRNKHQRKDRDKRSRSGERVQKLLMVGSSTAASIVLLLIGFYFGQKYGRGIDSSHQGIPRDAEAPSSASAGMLTHAFTALNAGNYRQAMSDFRKVHETQPSMTGIDYLISESAHKAGEDDLAIDAAGQAISKNESVDQARLLLALINLNRSKGKDQVVSQLVDPQLAAENEIKNYSAAHPADAKIYEIWGDLLRSEGSYRSAVDILHEGVVRASPEASRDVLSAKEQLARLQNEKAKSVPSLSELTSMSGEQALVAALASLQLHQSEEAAVFMEKARDSYSPQVFRELLLDMAFDDYRNDPLIKSFFKQGNSPRVSP